MTRTVWLTSSLSTITPAAEKAASAARATTDRTITDRGSSHAASISQSFLKPNGWVQEFFHAEVTENRLKFLADIHERFIFLFKRLLLYIHHLLLAVNGAEVPRPVPPMSPGLVAHEELTDGDSACAPLKNSAPLRQRDHLVGADSKFPLPGLRVPLQ